MAQNFHRKRINEHINLIKFHNFCLFSCLALINLLQSGYIHLNFNKVPSLENQYLKLIDCFLTSGSAVRLIPK